MSANNTPDPLPVRMVNEYAFCPRLDQMVTHPIFDYRCSWRAVVRVQAKLLAKTLRGDIPAYTGITTR